MPLGLEDYRIPNGALRASSSSNYNHGPERARINQPSGHSRSGAWVAKYRNANQWLQVELGRPAKVTGVATQGRYDSYQWVTSYTISYSMNGKAFKVYLEYGRSKVCDFHLKNRLDVWAVPFFCIHEGHRFKKINPDNII